MEVDGNILVPNGFHAVSLPFRDDIRELTFEEERPAATKPQVLLAKAVISELTYPVMDLCIPNPALQHHYQCLQALALESQLPEKEDSALMSEEVLAVPEIREAMDRFTHNVFPSGYDPQNTIGGVKSRTAAGSTSRAKSLASNPDASDSASGYNWVELVRSGEISRLNIPTLKLYLRAQDLSLSGRKADLVSRVEDDVRSRHPGP